MKNTKKKERNMFFLSCSTSEKSGLRIDSVFNIIHNKSPLERKLLR